MSFNFDMEKTYNAPIKQEYKVTQPDISDNNEKQKEEEKTDNGIADAIVSIMSSKSE